MTQNREITCVFWDLGGVILSNGWDTEARAEAARNFSVDLADFEDRHDSMAEALETARITFDAYLDHAVFYRPRTFTKQEFIAFVFSQSKENAESRAVLDDLTATRRYLLAVVNNESAELNAYRIRTFQLTRNFVAFLSSCYLGVRKPGEAIYRAALNITQRVPEECIFVDDRQNNLEVPARMGMRTIQFKSAAQLRSDLKAYGLL
jgi:putative hydrolase of the HAD superfamily